MWNPFLFTYTELTSVDDMICKLFLSSNNLTHVGISIVKGQKSAYCTICNIQIPLFSPINPDSTNADI